MGWSIGYDEKWKRDIGYGVPAICDHPDCGEEIDRGLSYVCGSEPYGGEYGCGLYFCKNHKEYHKPCSSKKSVELCDCCKKHKKPFAPKPDTAEWVEWKLTDESWAEWRAENPEWVKENENLLFNSKKEFDK